MKLVNWVAAIWLSATVLWCLEATAQSSYPSINENRFLNTYWRYVKMTYEPGALALHTADTDYQYFLYFRFDNTFQQLLHGETSTGEWRLNENRNELYYPFRQVSWWRIVRFSRETLILEFTDRSTGKENVYRYHFQAVKPDKTPFLRDPSLFPQVDVFARNMREVRAARRQERLIEREAQADAARRARYERPRPVLESRPQPEEIRIELTGGGYYGGVDPVLKDYILIKTDGRVLKEVQTVNRGLMKTTRNITRQQLEELVTFIRNKNFFELPAAFECETQLCQARQWLEPRPIPLRLAVTVGSYRKVVSIGIWGKDDTGLQYVSYPVELDQIIAAIQKLAR